MATLALAVKAIHQPSIKGRKLKLVTITGDTDIGAADTGYYRSAASLGFNVIQGCISGISQDGVYSVVGVPCTGASPGTPSTAGTSLRVQFYNIDDGVEAASGENGVDGTITDILVIGY